MADLELVEKLRERASVTYDEAKEALDACGDDLLEAVIYLEKKGKVPPPSGGSYTSKQSDDSKTYARHGQDRVNDVKFSVYAKSFFSWLGNLVKKSCVNMFEIWRYDKVVLAVPVIVLALLLIFCFWATVPLLILGLFFDLRYRFRINGMEKSEINDVIDSVADAAGKIKSDIKSAQEAQKTDNVYHMDKDN